ncbi:hypothetical protein BD560DRAFT_307783, partial [Blakeslea trispora]
WPIPSTIDEVQSLCESEQANGTSYTRLALCLHLMESAFQVDPHNDMILPSEEARRYSGMLEDMFLTLKLSTNSSAPNTLGEAMVMESKKLLKQLACGSNSMGERAESEAQFLLGNCYGMGALGWPINHKRAFQWYLQASKYGHPEATYRAAVCYELGIGTQKDNVRAFRFYKKAAHRSHVPSMYKLGVILLRGYYGQPISKREGVNWLQRAAYRKLTGSTNGAALPHALHTLALIHLSKECEDTNVLPDPVYAIKLLHEAARAGYAASQAKLGECYECGHSCQEDEAQSIYWYTLAAQQDYPDACLGLSSWYLTGAVKTGVLKQSDEQAYLWARKAAKLSREHHMKITAAKAYFALGVYHQNGIGVVKSLDIANKWYKKAAQHRHPEAIKM